MQFGHFRQWHIHGGDSRGGLRGGKGGGVDDEERGKRRRWGRLRERGTEGISRGGNIVKQGVLRA